MANKKRSKMTVIITNILFFVICLGIAYYTSTALLGVVPIDGESMSPTIAHKDNVLILRKAKVRHGDIVVFDSKAFKLRLIKRVIALGGDVVEIIPASIRGDRSIILINGTPLEENYLPDDLVMEYSHSEIVVPEGHFYFLGDNRSISKDSHMGSTDSTDTIVGRVALKYTSIVDIKIISNPFAIINDSLIDSIQRRNG